MGLDKASLRPPPEHENEKNHWLRREDWLVPAGYSRYGEHGRWALTDGCIYTDEGAWAMGLRYEKPCRPDAIVPDAAKIADHIVREVAELADRTSPDDWPEAMLVTGEELHLIVTEALAALARGDGT